MLFDVTGVPASAENLRISEVHYHPGAPTAQEQQAGFDDADEFEFIELVNISNSVVELAGVRLAQVSIADEVQGVDFQFDTATVRELAPANVCWWWKTCRHLKPATVPLCPWQAPGAVAWATAEKRLRC